MKFLEWTQFCNPCISNYPSADLSVGLSVGHTSSIIRARNGHGKCNGHQVGGGINEEKATTSSTKKTFSDVNNGAIRM